jgi:hypothetical protein
MAIAQPHELERPIYAVLLALYRRWLERQAAGFQALVKRDGYPGWSLPEVADGTVLLFVDGLRLDLARELEAALDKGNGLTVVLQPGFTSVPSVTRSGKVWVSPARKLADGGNGGDFAPRLPKGAYTADKLRGNGAGGCRRRRYREPEPRLWQGLGGVSRRHRWRRSRQGPEAGVPFRPTSTTWPMPSGACSMLAGSRSGW